MLVCGHMLTGEMLTPLSKNADICSQDLIFFNHFLFIYIHMYLYLKCNFTTSSCMSECQLILTNKSNAWRPYIVWDGCADMTRTSAVGGRAARRSCLSGLRLGGGRQAATMTWSQSPEYCCTGSTQTHCRWDERWAEMTRNCAGVDDDLNLTIRVVFHLPSAETRSVRVNSTQLNQHST